MADWLLQLGAQKNTANQTKPAISVQEDRADQKTKKDGQRVDHRDDMIFQWTSEASIAADTT